MNYELPSAPLSIGGVLDNAIRLYRHAMARCWILAVIYATVLGAFSIAWALALAKVVASGGAGGPAQMAGLFTSPVTIGGFLLAIIVSMTLYGALVKAEVSLARGEESYSVGMALGVGLRRLPGVLLAFLIMMVGVALLLVPGVYVLSRTRPLGAFLLIITGVYLVYLVVKMQLWIVAMFVDDTSAWESIKTSWRLTRKRWWRTLVILSVSFILIYVFALAFGLISGVLTVVMHVSIANRLIVNQVFSFFSNIIIMPMTVAIAVVMYHDYKLRSEGGDLALRVGSLGKA